MKWMTDVMTIFFELCCIFMIWTDYRIHRHLINTVSVLSIPYMFIVPINNFYAVKFGFYKIENNVILMLLVGIFCFFIGSVVTNFRNRVSITDKIVDFEQNTEKFSYYKMKSMKRFVLLIEIICLVRLLLFVGNRGFSALASDTGENLISGIVGHLYLMIYAVLPIVFYYWLKNKKEITYLLIYLFGLSFAFLSFTKYHSIGLVVLTYLLVAFEDHKYIKKGAVVIVAFAIAIFMSNYMLGFFSRGVLGNINSNFYMLHLWKYIGGSVVHDNTIFTTGQNLDAGFIHKLLYCTIALPAMFLSGLFGIEIELPVHIPLQLVGSNSEASNVLDFIGFMYPSKGGAIDVFLFLIIMISIGVVFSLIYNAATRRTKQFAITICVFMTFFEFLSFFGVFASKSMTWEVIAWSILIPALFDKRIIIRWH